MKMSKAQRLIALIIAVNIRRHFTIGELASEFGVSYRTIWRDLRDLEDLGMPLYAEVAQAVDIGWPTSACCRP